MKGMYVRCCHVHFWEIEESKLVSLHTKRLDPIKSQKEYRCTLHCDSDTSGTVAVCVVYCSIFWLTLGDIRNYKHLVTNKSCHIWFTNLTKDQVHKPKTLIKVSRPELQREPPLNSHRHECVCVIYTDRVHHNSYWLIFTPWVSRTMPSCFIQADKSTLGFL